MLLKMALFHSFLCLSSIPVYMFNTSYLSIHLFDGHMGCFHVLAIVNNVAMKIRAHVSFWIRVLSVY